jgi:hypothetical protein
MVAFPPALMLVAALLVAPAPLPPPSERFPASTPGHVLVVLDVASGELVRSGDPEAAAGEPFPLGDALRPLLALAALEGGQLEPEESIRCDSRCWANGAHGEPTHVSAAAWSCDTFFLELRKRLAWEAVRDWSIRAGFLPAADGDEVQATVEAMAEFWRSLGRGRLPISESTLSELLAAGGISVVSPRGVARALNRPRLGARAEAGAAGDGAWVAGLWQLSTEQRWAFALYLREGTTTLATARCANLLEETARVIRSSSHERGGRPWPLDE